MYILVICQYEYLNISDFFFLLQVKLTEAFGA